MGWESAFSELFGTSWRKPGIIKEVSPGANLASGTELDVGEQPPVNADSIPRGKEFRVGPKTADQPWRATGLPKNLF